MISFKLNNKEALRVFDNLANGIGDFKPALKQVSGYQLKEIEKQYKTEGRNILGSKWKKLKKNTIKARLRAGFGASPILTASGKMRKAHKRKKLTKNTLEIGNDVKYFKFHQLGTRKTSKRQVHGFSNTMVTKILKIVGDYIIRIAKK